MNNKQFISNLSSVTADIRKLDAKRINLNGQNIEDLWGFQTPKDFKKLCTRCELPEDKPWALWTDTGNLVYFNQSDRIVNGKKMFYRCSNLTSFASNLSSLVDGSDMFYECTNLTSFASDLSSLVYGDYMFYGAPLTSFSGDLSSLTNGNWMFRKCKLNKESVINIINCLKNSNTCSSNADLTLDIDASLKTDTELQTFLGITEGATSTTLVGHGGGTWAIELGWK